MNKRVCACVCVSAIFPGNGHQLCARAQLSSLGIHQTPDRAPSRMAVGMSVPCERSKSSVARRSNHQGIYCPHDEWGERIKRTGLERRKTEGVEAADKGCGEMKGAAWRERR